MSDMVLKSIDVGPMRSVRDSFTGPYIVTMPPVLTDFSKFDFKGKNIIVNSASDEMNFYTTLKQPPQTMSHSFKILIEKIILYSCVEWMISNKYGQG